MCVTWTRGKVMALCPYYARAEAGGLAFKGKRALQSLPPTSTSRLITMSRFSAIRDRCLPASRKGRQS